MKIQSLNHPLLIISAIILAIIQPEALSSPLHKVIGSHLVNGIKFGHRWLQRTKETRSKISQAILGLSAASLATNCIIDKINDARKWNGERQFNYGDGYEHWQWEPQTKDPAYHEQLKKISQAFLFSGAFTFPVAPLIRFPTTCALALGAAEASAEYRRRARSAYERDYEKWKKDPVNLHND